VVNPGGSDGDGSGIGEPDPDGGGLDGVDVTGAAASSKLAGELAQTGATALRQAIHDLREAAELSAQRLGSGPAEDALATAVRLEERLERGVDHTIVALQGGTGSGKSSLFNALAEMNFAEVSVLRPTTRQATACVWGPGAEDLLDWLGIERGAWIKRDSVLERHIGELRGLILVDLPDFDSAVDDHHIIADRILPLADVLVWVTDPQKYADPALHERFVAAARVNQDRANLVVLNQIDTVSPDQAEQIEQALTELLVADGMSDPVVALTSAVTLDGVAAVRAELMARTSRQTTALRRVAADLSLAAKQLADQTESQTPTSPDWIEQAAVQAGQAVIGLIAPGPRVQPAQALEVAQARTVTAAWMAQAMPHLTSTWVVSLAEALATPGNLTGRLSTALDGVEVPPRPGFGARLFRRAAADRARRAEWLARLVEAVTPVVERALTGPTRALLADRERIGQLTAGAARAAADLGSAG
jgi:GTP-binding protein EngB required for normal cell division